MIAVIKPVGDQRNRATFLPQKHFGPLLNRIILPVETTIPGGLTWPIGGLRCINIVK